MRGCFAARTVFCVVFVLTLALSVVGCSSQMDASLQNRLTGKVVLDFISPISTFDYFVKYYNLRDFEMVKSAFTEEYAAPLGQITFEDFQELIGYQSINYRLVGTGEITEDESAKLAGIRMPTYYVEVQINNDDLIIQFQMLEEPGGWRIHKITKKRLV